MTTPSSTSSLAREAAAEATCLWLDGDYDACLQTLERLDLDQSFHNRDLKHNIAVVEHYCHGKKDPERLLEQLTQVITDQPSSKATEPVAFPSPHRAAATATAEPGPSRIDEDAAVCNVNKAILLYRDQRYPEALQLLNPLLEQLDALDEGTALHCCILLLDIHLQQRDFQQTGAVLAALERAYPSLQDAFAGTLGSGQQGDAVKQPDAAAGQEPGCNGMSSPEGQEHGQQQPQAEQQGREKLAVDISLPFVSKWGSSTMAHAQKLLAQRGHHSPEPPNLRMLVKLYRARLALVQKNLRAARRELRGLTTGESSTMLASSASSGQLDQANSDTAGESTSLRASDSSQGSDAVPGPSQVVPSAAALAKAHYELLRGSSRKAARLLMGMVQQGAEAGAGTSAAASQPVLLNNLGVVHHRHSKHQMAALYFKQAMDALPDKSGEETQGHTASSNEQQGTAAGAHGGPSRASMSHASCAMTYNAGMQHMMLHNYEAALRCFGRCMEALEASGVSVRRPALLLRAAEAALGLYEQQTAGKGGITDAAAGEGPSRDQASGILPPASGSSSQQLLHQALAWLQGSYQMLEDLKRQRQEQRDAALATQTAAASSGIFLNAEDARPAKAALDMVSWQDALDLKEAACSKLAYVQLLLRDHEAALAVAKQTLTLQCLESDVAQSAACYAAEALSALGRESDAVAMLTAYEHQEKEFTPALIYGSAQIAGQGLAAQAATPRPKASGSGQPASPFSPMGTEAPQQPSQSAGATEETQGGGLAGGMYPLPMPDVLPQAPSRTGRVALCTNLAAVLTGQPEEAQRARALVSEAREHDPGSRPATLLVAYMDMMSGRCDSALDMLRELQC